MIQFCLSLICFIFCVFLEPSFAKSNDDFGVGVILGAPTGISVDKKLSRSHSVDGALSYGSYFYVHGTYLNHFLRSIRVEDYSFGWFYGIGARLFVLEKNKREEEKKELYLGPRGSIGLNFPIKQNPFEFFIEGSCVLNVIPETGVDLGIAVGGRFYF